MLWRGTVVLLVLSSATLQAQTITDGLMVPKKDLMTGFVYTHDSWDEYWEATLKRSNGNIGTVTTQTVAWVGNYGVTSRLNLLAAVPYVWSSASQGVLHGMSGIQDLTLAAKFNLLETEFTKHGRLRTIVVGTAGLPLSDYNQELLPLSIGLQSQTWGGRLTLFFEAKQGWFVNGSAGYTWRGNVTLDRQSYFTDGRLYLTDEVSMPDVFDYTVSVGYMRKGLLIPISFSEQVTLGGGDIRRQDMPFLSNRMNVSRLDGLVMYTLPKTKDLALRIAASYAVNGRNVGQATTFTAGLLYTFHF